MCSNTLVSLFSPRPSLHHILILQPKTQNNLGFSFYTVCVEKVQLTKNMYKSHKKNQEKWLTIFILSFCGGLSNKNGWKRHKNTRTHVNSAALHSQPDPAISSFSGCRERLTTRTTSTRSSSVRYGYSPLEPWTTRPATQNGWHSEPRQGENHVPSIYIFFFSKYQNSRRYWCHLRYCSYEGRTLFTPPGVPFGKITSCSLWNLMVNGTLISTLRGTTSQTKYLTKLEGLTFRLKKRKLVSVTLSKNINSYLTRCIMCFSCLNSSSNV